MRVLRLSNSNDEYHRIAPEDRAPAVAARRVTQLTGEPVETVIRYIWPAKGLGDRMEEWVNELQPDVVLVRASSFWVNFESVPVKFERRFGKRVRPVARAGLKVGGNPKFSHNRAFRLGRVIAARTIGGATYFEPQLACDLLMAAVQRICRDESLVVVVRGPSHAHNTTSSVRGLRTSERRRAELERCLDAECKKLRVPFVPRREPLTADHLLNDDVHDNEEGHRLNGELDGDAIAEAWLAARRRH